MQPFTPPPPPGPPSGAGGRPNSLFFHRADNRPHWMQAASRGHASAPISALCSPVSSSSGTSFSSVPPLQSTPLGHPHPQRSPFPPVAASASAEEVGSAMSPPDGMSSIPLGSGTVSGTVQPIDPAASSRSGWGSASRPPFLPLSELEGRSGFRDLSFRGPVSSPFGFSQVPTPGTGAEAVDNSFAQANSAGMVAVDGAAVDVRGLPGGVTGAVDVSTGCTESRASDSVFAALPAGPPVRPMLMSTGLIPGEFPGVAAASFGSVNDAWAHHRPDSLFCSPENPSGAEVPGRAGSSIPQTVASVGAAQVSQHHVDPQHVVPHGAFQGRLFSPGGVASECPRTERPDEERGLRASEMSAEDPTARNMQKLLEQQQTMIRQLMLQVQQQQQQAATLKKRTEEAQKRDVGKPESYEVIGSSSWCRVETTTGMKYFYNRETKQATWSCPPEIADIVRQIDVHMGGTGGSAPVPASSPSKPADSPDPGKSEKRLRGEEEEELEECASSSESSDEESEEAKQLKRQIARYEAFKQMLREKNLSPFAQYEKTLPKLLFDPRFAAIPPDQRKRLFEKCLKEITAESRRGQKEHIDAFRELMNELYGAGHIHASSTVETLEKRCGHDARWLGGTVPSADWEPIRRRLVQETVERRKQEKDQKKNNIRRDFRRLMRDKMAERPREEWAALRKELRTHPKYLQLGSASERERIFQQVCEELTLLNEEKKRSTTAALEDADNKRMRLVKTEAAAAFMNMLVERVKNPFAHGDVGAEMPVELLKGDSRFNTGALTDAEKNKLFVSFVEEFTNSRMRLFLARLNTLPCEKLSATFDEVLEELQTNKRLFDGLPQAELLASYEQWKRSKSKELKEAFVLFLRQNPDVSRGADDDGEKFASLLEKLQKDVRYQRLDYIPDERLELVKQRIREVNLECARKPPIAAAKQQSS